MQENEEKPGKTRVIVAGSRDFDDMNLLKQHMDGLLADIGPMVVLSGDARGADRLGAKWARDNGVEVRTYPAQWEKWGKQAGIIRNIEMAENADRLIAFWDGESRGTAHMIKTADNMRLQTTVVLYRDTPR